MASPWGATAFVLVPKHRTEREKSAAAVVAGQALGNTGVASCGVAVGASLWLLWFSWGDPRGYATWAVVGAVVTALAVDAGFSDTTGLWVLGYLMTLGGGTVVLALLAAGIVVVRSDDWADRPCP